MTQKELKEMTDKEIQKQSQKNDEVIKVDGKGQKEPRRS
jgi:hypothetical protein